MPAPPPQPHPKAEIPLSSTHRPLPLPSSQPASQLARLVGSPSGARGGFPSQATLEAAARSAAVPREAGRARRADLHCAACSRGHRRCTQGPRWRCGAIRWWLSSDNLHNRCPLSWRPTGREGGSGGVASAGWAPTPPHLLPDPGATPAPASLDQEQQISQGKHGISEPWNSRIET